MSRGLTGKFIYPKYQFIIMKALLKAIIIFGAVMGIWYISGFLYGLVPSRPIEELVVHLVRIILLVALSFIFYKFQLTESLKALGIKKEGLLIGTAVTIGLCAVFAILGGLFNNQLGIQGSEYYLSFFDYWFSDTPMTLFQLGLPFIGWMIIYFIAVGFEELVFRGLILNYIIDNMNSSKLVSIPIAILANSILFGIYHFNSIFDVQFQIATILFGIFASILTLLFRRNIFPVILLHLLSNTWVPLMDGLGLFFM